MAHINKCKGNIHDNNKKVVKGEWWMIVYSIDDIKEKYNFYSYGDAMLIL